MSDRFEGDRKQFEGDYRIIDHRFIERGDARDRKYSLYDDGLKTPLPENEYLNMIDYKLPVSSGSGFDKNSGSEMITHDELSRLRRLAAFVVPTNVEPPISDEEIQQLGRTPAEDILNRQVIDRITGTVRGFRSLPQAPEFVAVIEAARGFTAKQDSLDLRYAPIRSFENTWLGDNGVNVGIGRTALFEVTPYHGQEQMIQERIDDLVATRQPVEG